MMKCPSCKRKISYDAQNCPKCGHPISSGDITSAREFEKKQKDSANRAGKFFVWVLVFWGILIFIIYMTDKDSYSDNGYDDGYNVIREFNNSDKGKRLKYLMENDLLE